MGKKIPTLSVRGWIDTVEEKADYVMSCFFTSQYSQTVHYPDNIASLPYLIKRYTGNDLQSNARTALDDLLRNNFDSVDVTVQVQSIDGDSPDKVKIRFDCIIQEDGREYSLARQVQYLNGILERIIDLNNS